jgi:uncharacterized membrane protein YeaQ/YmgE (transglycosylase-associated protein family)
MDELWGIASWTAAGLLLALVVRWLPPWRPGSLLVLLGSGLLGAWAGGVLATVLGFGGLAGFDARSLVTAALAALFALLLPPLWRTRPRSDIRAGSDIRARSDIRAKSKTMPGSDAQRSAPTRGSSGR